MSENVVCTTDDIGDEYHYLFTCDFFKSDKKLYLKSYFYVSQIYARIGSFLPQPIMQRSLNYQFVLQLLWTNFCVDCFSK